jgi:EAL domain-containing protein (putative c-di-GMP-specific phosphodiesterase class I)/ActR/RegA family two-component response regulator
VSPNPSDIRESQLVLLLDDDVAITEGLAAGLERPGRTVISCNDVESAEMMVDHFHPSHIVADIRISGPFSFEGLDFIRFAKRHAPESRIILISGEGGDALQLEASERGAVAFLQKPFEVRELDATLDLLRCSALSAISGESSIIRVPTLDDILESDALHSFFQPIVRLDDGSVIGYESLARLRSESPFRHPDMLFRYATRKHRVGDLEVACIQRSLQEGLQLSKKGLLFLNLHPDVLAAGPKFSDRLVDQAARAGIALDRLVLEITEQASLTGTRTVLNAIADLRSRGVRFAFDDVGVAYSHLPLMDAVRPTFLKVSQHFGTGFETDPTRTKIVVNLLSLARDFNCQLILEGVEDQSSATAAAELGITFAQGFFFARPAPASTFLE